MKQFWMAAASATVLMLVGCAKDTPAETPEPTTEPEVEETTAEPKTGAERILEAASGPSGVAVWKTGDEDTTVYLMGTVHILNPEIEWKHDVFQTAWDEADAVYFEADVASPAAANEAASLITELGVNPPGVTLSSYFTEDEIAQINAALAPMNITLQMLDPLRPWLASVQVTSMAITSVGGRQEAGIDMILYGEADAAGKEKRFFETVREQVEILSSGEDAEAARLFLEGLEDLEDPAQYFAELVGAWYHGDEAGIEKIMVEAMEGEPEVAAGLLYNRNKNWAGQLDALITEEEGTFFVAVGAAHLVGEKSVQDYLTEYGHETSRLN